MEEVETERKLLSSGRQSGIVVSQAVGEPPDDQANSTFLKQESYHQSDRAEQVEDIEPV